MDIPKVSVIIPAKAKSPYLAGCLQSVIDLDYPYFDIILVDDGLDENAKRIVERYSDQVKVLSSSGKGPSAARNVAAHYSEAQFLAFTDADCLVEREWLNQLLKGFEADEAIVSCGGSQKLPDQAGFFQTKVFSFMKKAGFLTDYMRSPKQEGMSKVGHNPSCNVIYKRDVFLKEKGFLEGFWPGEDVELDYRLRRKGHVLVFNPQAVVYHYRPKGLGPFLAMMHRYGFAQGFLVRRYGIFRRIQFFGLVSFCLAALILLAAFFNKVLAGFFVLGLIAASLIYFFDLLSFGLSIGAFFWWHWGFLLGLFKK